MRCCGSCRASPTRCSVWSRAILELAPFGVFALAIPLASKLGTLGGRRRARLHRPGRDADAAGRRRCCCIRSGSSPGRCRRRRSLSFCAPAQAVAFASRSSLAALPAMVESAERAELPPVVSRFIMPLAASVFRVGAAVAMPVGVLFLARLYGVSLSPAQLASVVFTVILRLVRCARRAGRQHHRDGAGAGRRSTCRSTASASCSRSTRFPTCSARRRTSPAAWSGGGAAAVRSTSRHSERSNGRQSRHLLCSPSSGSCDPCRRILGCLRQRSY